MAKSVLSRPDFIGAFASGLCILHCLFAPLFFVAHPVVYQAVSHRGHYHGDGFWALLDYVFLFISLLAVWFAHRPQHSWWVKAGLWGGWACFGLGLLLEDHLVTGAGMMYLGSGVLVLTHLVNLRWGNRKPSLPRTKKMQA